MRPFCISWAIAVGMLWAASFFTMAWAFCFFILLMPSSSIGLRPSFMRTRFVLTMSFGSKLSFSSIIICLALMALPRTSSFVEIHFSTLLLLTGSVQDMTTKYLLWDLTRRAAVITRPQNRLSSSGFGSEMRLKPLFPPSCPGYRLHRP